jgi:thioesterase domain-containing protein
MADRYLREIRAVQPHGPYRLVGWSMGGVVAYEMARQLRAAGEEVGRLVLIDSRNPSDGDGWLPSGDLDVLRAFALELGVPLENCPIAAADLEALSPADLLPAIWDACLADGLVPPDLGLTRLRRLHQVFACNVEALRAYVPEPARGDALLLRAAVERSEGGDLGWRRLLGEGLLVREVPGSHHTMLSGAHLAVLADHLAAYLGVEEPA